MPLVDRTAPGQRQDLPLEFEAAQVASQYDAALLECLQVEDGID